MSNPQALLLLLLGGGGLWLLMTQARPRICPLQHTPTNKVAMTLLFYWVEQGRQYVDLTRAGIAWWKSQ